MEIAGSLRRRCETIGDLDLLVSVPATQREAVVDHFLAAPSVLQPIERGATKAAAVVAGGLRADLRLVESGELASALLHFTGSKEHNVELRSRAKSRGWTLNEYGLHEGDRTASTSTSERAIYAKLGLAWIPPEAREGLGEIELAALASSGGRDSRAGGVRRPARNAACAHRLERRHRFARGDGRGGGEARLGVSRHR